MKLLNLISRIEELRTKYRVSDDNPLNPKLVLDWINTYRSKLIRQDVEKGRPISQFLLQELEMELEQVDKSLGTKTGTCILKTKNKLPQPIEGQINDYLTYVGRIDYEQDFTLIPESRVSFFTYSKYGTIVPRYYIKEGYIYIAIPPTSTIKRILVRGAFNEPQKVEEIKNTIDYFNPYDWEYPISIHTFDTIELMILKDKFAYTQPLPLDNENDGTQQ